MNVRKKKDLLTKLLSSSPIPTNSNSSRKITFFVTSFFDVKRADFGILCGILSGVSVMTKTEDKGKMFCFLLNDARVK